MSVLSSDALAGQLSARDDGALRSVAEMEAAAREAPAHGVAGAALGLPRPAEATALLRRMLEDENGLVALEAAATLALLGDRSGLAALRSPAGATTNSGIECFLAHAALLLLREPIPPPARRARSVFVHLEQLIDAAG